MLQSFIIAFFSTSNQASKYRINMSRKIALFPLQIVVFPGEALNLHIFEPRYRQLVKDCAEENITFAIPSFQNGTIKEFATEVRLLRIAKTYPGGEMDINTQGMGLVRIHDFYPQLGDKLYAGGLVSDFAHEANENLLINEQILDMVRDLFRLMKIDKPLPASAVGFSTYDIAHYIGFNLEQEYDLLMTIDAVARQQMMLDQIRRMVLMLKEMENLRNRASLNGHFKNLIPPM